MKDPTTDGDLTKYWGAVMFCLATAQWWHDVNKLQRRDRSKYRTTKQKPNKLLRMSYTETEGARRWPDTIRKNVHLRERSDDETYLLVLATQHKFLVAREQHSNYKFKTKKSTGTKSFTYTEDVWWNWSYRWGKEVSPSDHGVNKQTEQENTMGTTNEHRCSRRHYPLLAKPEPTLHQTK